MCRAWRRPLAASSPGGAVCGRSCGRSRIIREADGAVAASSRKPNGGRDITPDARATHRFVSGRRTKWVVIVAWIVAVVALSPLGAKLADVTSDETASFLPAGRRVDEGPGAAQGPLPRRRDEHRADRLPARRRADRRRQGADRADARDGRRGDPGHAARAVVPFTPARRRASSRHDGDAAYTVVTVPLDFEKIADWGKETREVDRRPGRRRARRLRDRRPRAVRRLRGGLRRARRASCCSRRSCSC